MVRVVTTASELLLYKDWHMQRGMEYLKKIPGGEVFDCRDMSIFSDSEELYKISAIFRYDTLGKALIRLRTHHVGAGLFLFIVVH